MLLTWGGRSEGEEEEEDEAGDDEDEADKSMKEEEAEESLEEEAWKFVSVSPEETGEAMRLWCNCKLNVDNVPIWSK